MSGKWDESSSDIASLYNPAFCGEIIRRFIYGYVEGDSPKIPVSICYLILPILLHNESRAKINTRSKKQLHTWIQENPELKINFANRVNNYIRVTNQAINFLFQLGSLSINEDGLIEISASYKPRNFKRLDILRKEYFNKAEYLGKVFEKVNSEYTTFIIFGVKP